MNQYHRIWETLILYVLRVKEVLEAKGGSFLEEHSTTEEASKILWTKIGWTRDKCSALRDIPGKMSRFYWQKWHTAGIHMSDRRLEHMRLRPLEPYVSMIRRTCCGSLQITDKILLIRDSLEKVVFVVEGFL